MAEPAAGGTDTLAVADIFLADGVSGAIANLRFNASDCTTVIATTEPLPANAPLAGRPVRLGAAKSGQWRVVKEAAGRELVIWGRLEADTNPAHQFEILRSFTLKPDAPAGFGARLPFSPQ